MMMTTTTMTTMMMTTTTTTSKLYHRNRKDRVPLNEHLLIGIWPGHSLKGVYSILKTQ
jgi:hypothetical protein